MEIPVLVEPVSGNGYRARGIEPFAYSADGATPEEAMQKLRTMLQARLAAGARFLSLELPVAQHPLPPFAGIFKEDDPIVQEWIEIMAENRKKADEDPNYP